MAMFNSSARENYDAFYTVLQNPADTSALEREQTPGTFEGALGAPGTGVYRGISRGASLLGNVATPALRPIAQSIDEIFGSSTDEWLLAEQEKANQSLIDSTLDPKTNGAAAQLLYGLGDVLTTLLTTRGSAALSGGLYGTTQAQIGLSEGLDPTTAIVKGGLEGAGLAVGVKVAPSLAGGLAARITSGAAINAGVGIATRFPVSQWLEARGYSEMAQQYAPLDATAIGTDMVLGGVFGGAFGARGQAKIAPSTVDAALTANQAHHVEVDAAPGIPVNTRSRQAHTAAMSESIDAMLNGREVNVESLLDGAEFVGKQADVDAMRVIADELDKAGVSDLAQEVRALEEQVKARGLVVDDAPMYSRGAKPRIMELADPAARETFAQRMREQEPSIYEAAQPDPVRVLLDSMGDKARTADELTSAFRAMFGEDANRLLKAGRTEIVQSVADLPGGPHPADVGGMFWRGKSYIVADNTNLTQLRGRALHEIGVHAGMRKMLGAEMYADVLARLEAKVETDPMFKHARELAEKNANKPEHVPEETLAYLVENAPELPLVRRILALVRQWLYRTTGGRYMDLTQADLQVMAASSLRRVAREADGARGGDEVPRYQADTAAPTRRSVEQFHSEVTRSADTMPDPIEDTTLPDARDLSDQVDAEIASATELSKGFLPAVECAMRAGA